MTRTAIEEIRNEQGQQVIYLDECSDGALYSIDPVGYYYLAWTGFKLVSVSPKKWKLISSTTGEIMLDESENWKILLNDGNEIVSIPYGNIKRGEWMLITHDVNCGIKNEGNGVQTFVLNIHSDKVNSERNGLSNFKAFDDGDDDEENIMRGLSSGNGDLFGF